MKHTRIGTIALVCCLLLSLKLINHWSDHSSQPMIYVITPTYPRPQQKAELTRLCHTFLLVPNIHWIVIEDVPSNSKLVQNFLLRCGVGFTLLHQETPSGDKVAQGESRHSKPRGVYQRNTGLQWLQDTFGQVPESQIQGVIYFADDDNTYSLDLFQAMRDTEKVSVWPVGLVGKLMVEKPQVDANGQVVGWDVDHKPERPFALDMAGFAVNLRFYLNRGGVKFLTSNVPRGYQESSFLSQLQVTLKDLEAKAVKQVLVWHTRAEKVNLNEEKARKGKNILASDTSIEV